MSSTNIYNSEILYTGMFSCIKYFYSYAILQLYDCIIIW